jgi:hypothetical protein
MHHYFTYNPELERFNQELNQAVNIQKEKEIDILFALNDILPENIAQDCDFVQSSLNYLKEYYGLSKGGWQVLLKLYEKIPDLKEQLSTLDNIYYFPDYYDKYKFIRDKISLNHIGPIGNLPFYATGREYHLQKFFNLISLLSSHLGLDNTVKYIGLFLSQFDTGESVFSINRLYQLRKQGHENLTNSIVNFFAWRLEALHRIHPVLRRISWRYAYIQYKLDGSKNHRENIINLINYLKIDTDNPADFFFDWVHTYQKYTDKPFLSFNGLTDIQNQIIQDDEQHYTIRLLDYFHTYHKYNDSSQKVLIEMVKFISQYENNFEKGLDKLFVISDYLSRSNDFTEKLVNEDNFSLNRLLQWSNQWHVKGESRGEFKEFKDYNIDLNIDNYSFEQIKNNYELHEEGVKQSHCVYSYEKDCLENNAIIVSMKDSTGKRVSTLRFKKNTIKEFFKKTSWSFAENRKRFNRNCTVDEKAIAEQYFKQIKKNLL